jgi:hypothetical protein
MSTGVPDEVGLDEMLDELEPFRIAAEWVPALKRGRNGATHAHEASLYRWTTTGCRGVRLRSVLVGSCRCTCRRWLSQFFAELTQRADEGNEVPVAMPATTRPARRRRLDQVDRELDAMGI